VLYPYLYLFGRSGGDRDMPPGSLGVLRRWERSKEARG
jgi:hypothetical protein